MEILRCDEIANYHRKSSMPGLARVRQDTLGDRDKF